MPDPEAMLPDTLLLPAHVLHTRGAIRKLLPECLRYGRRGLILHGRALETRGTVASLLGPAPDGSDLVILRHQGGEPTVAELDALIQKIHAHGTEWVAGIGGGSVLDLAKAAAALANAPRDPWQYHDGAPLETPGIPFIAAPTTAGTGSEATVNAVLTNERTNCKKSIRDHSMMARIVILDADLLTSCPHPVIAASGMDALTQAIEAFTSRHATTFSDALALEGIRLLSANLLPGWENPESPHMDALLSGSFLAGIALSSARLGVVHGIAHPLGSIYHMPHGQVCAACLPHAIDLNREVIGRKYDRMSQTIGTDLQTFVRQLASGLGLGRPFAGLPVKDRERIIAETLSSGSTKANPKTIDRKDVEWMLDRLFRI